MFLLKNSYLPLFFLPYTFLIFLYSLVSLFPSTESSPLEIIPLFPMLRLIATPVKTKSTIIVTTNATKVIALSLLIINFLIFSTFSHLLFSTSLFFIILYSTKKPYILDMTKTHSFFAIFT